MLFVIASAVHAYQLPRCSVGSPRVAVRTTTPCATTSLSLDEVKEENRRLASEIPSALTTLLASVAELQLMRLRSSPGWVADGIKARFEASAAERQAKKAAAEAAIQAEQEAAMAEMVARQQAAEEALRERQEEAEAALLARQQAAEATAARIKAAPEELAAKVKSAPVEIAAKVKAAPTEVSAAVKGSLDQASTQVQLRALMAVESALGQLADTVAATGGALDPADMEKELEDADQTTMFTLDTRGDGFDDVRGVILSREKEWRQLTAYVQPRWEATSRTARLTYRWAVVITQELLLPFGRSVVDLIRGVRIPAAATAPRAARSAPPRPAPSPPTTSGFFGRVVPTRLPAKQAPAPAPPQRGLFGMVKPTRRPEPEPEPEPAKKRGLLSFAR